jgi:hypothetical protein
MEKTEAKKSRATVPLKGTFWPERNRAHWGHMTFSDLTFQTNYYCWIFTGPSKFLKG